MQVPAPFDYARASSVDDAIALLDRLGPEARLVAGGHSLLPMMKLRLATPEHLIDINPLEGELNYVREAEELIADPPVRNRGTIGGALCQADPSEDLSAVCAALGAHCVIRGAAGERVVDMDEFHQGPYETAVGDAEMLVEVRIPIRPHGGSAYEKVKRRTGDWATAASGVALWMDGGNIGAAGIALSAVNPASVHSDRAEQALVGRPPSEEAFATAAALAAEDCDPVSDQRGPADYKRHLAQELTHRALRRAATRALAA
jgi:carbon-monoxide dehydrogenase medium subunit